MKMLNFFLIPALLFSACTNSGSGDAKDKAAEEQAAPKTYTLTPFSPSTEFPDARIVSMEYKDGMFNFEIGGDSYQLGVQTPDAPQKMCADSPDGQHIHLIIDNEPYAAKYETSFEYDVPDGDHYLLAFLSRSYHESIKTEAASEALRITVRNKSITGTEEITDPMIFYSRPKGNYLGEEETKKVMLDFYLVNVELGDEYKVKAEINGEEHMIDKWQPYYIEGLPLGDNKIKLTLVDKTGEPVFAPLNPVERTFTLLATPGEVQ
jgi:hypothetical protein